MPHPNRYLIGFDARQTLHRFTDVLVVGAGIAGLRAALAVPADLGVLVVMALIGLSVTARRIDRLLLK